MRSLYVCLFLLVLGAILRIITSDFLEVGDPRSYAILFAGNGRACEVWTPTSKYVVWGDMVAVVNE